MLTIYHNPRCSKSRACLQLLQEKGVKVGVVDYRQQPLSLELLHTFASELGIQAMVRSNEPTYTELGLAHADEETILKAIIKFPQLLQRPIVVDDKRILIARPPEKVLEWLND
ncbi:arsenate reductase (glutaredoxin) [Legionella fairfieldensis]|uniref:arsenate reductase (glutaredoxin) n=1 Tax=Legionella fairfieldensis TaxID=45064 RepID=UPI000490463E|nr:arsenate reductase (glutaredoxin) [Legionella fairfieldensis]